MTACRDGTNTIIWYSAKQAYGIVHNKLASVAMSIQA